jgi:hypothetical protein
MMHCVALTIVALTDRRVRRWKPFVAALVILALFLPYWMSFAFRFTRGILWRGQIFWESVRPATFKITLSTGEAIDIEWKPGMKPRPYDLGFRGNFRHFFGGWWSRWFFGTETPFQREGARLGDAYLEYVETCNTILRGPPPPSSVAPASPPIALPPSVDRRGADGSTGTDNELRDMSAVRQRAQISEEAPAE